MKKLLVRAAVFLFRDSTRSVFFGTVEQFIQVRVILVDGLFDLRFVWMLLNPAEHESAIDGDQRIPLHLKAIGILALFRI